MIKISKFIVAIDAEASMRVGSEILGWLICEVPCHKVEMRDRLFGRPLRYFNSETINYYGFLQQCPCWA